MPITAFEQWLRTQQGRSDGVSNILDLLEMGSIDLEGRFPHTDNIKEALFRGRDVSEDMNRDFRRTWSEFLKR